MKIQDKQEIKDIKERLREGMIDFIEPGITSYTKKEVDKCMGLLDTYLLEIENTRTKEEGMSVVKKTVLALNELNEDFEFELIETEQREDIAEIIILAGNLKGYNDLNEDITEEWRDW